jgi:hypothetical protein
MQWKSTLAENMQINLTLIIELLIYGSLYPKAEMF